MDRAWRPEGWETPNVVALKDVEAGWVTSNQVRFLSQEEKKAYEDGADAMLKALRERYNPRLLTPLSPFPIVFKGSKLVLIPDEEVQDGY